MAAPYSVETANIRPGTQWNVESSYTAGFVAPSSYLLKRDIRNKIFDAYDERMLYDFLIHSNKTLRTVNTTYRWFEHDSYFHTHTVESFTGSGGAGNIATYTLEEVDHLATGTLSEIKVKDVVLVYTATAVIKGYVTATNKTVAETHTVSVDPIDDSVDLVGASANGDKITVISSAASDGAAMTAATSRLPVDYYGYVQIIDTQKKTNGGEAANEAEVTVDGKPFYYHQMVVDGDFEQRAKIENAIVFGTRGTKPDPVTSETAYFTAGLEWYADNLGYAEPYSSSFALGDLQNVCRNLDIEKAPNRQLLLTGNELDMSIDDFVKGRLDNTAVDWTQMGVGSAAGRMADFGIDGFRYNGYTFMKKKWNLLNALGLTGGFSASSYPKMGFSVSWDRFTGGDNKEYDTVSLRYKSSDRENRFMQFWTRDKTITNEDKFEFNHKSEVGLMVGLARHVNKIYEN